MNKLVGSSIYAMEVLVWALFVFTSNFFMRKDWLALIFFPSLRVVVGDVSKLSCKRAGWCPRTGFRSLAGSGLWTKPPRPPHGGSRLVNALTHEAPVHSCERRGGDTSWSC